MRLIDLLFIMGGYHADTVAWRTAVVAAGGTLTDAELSAHDTWRREIGDTIAAKFRTAHMYWVADATAKRVPYFRTWGSSTLTVDGAPTADPRGYTFGGIAGQRVRTGITPSSQSGFSQLDQFFLAWTYGKSTAASGDQAICGARSNSGTYRTGANWRTTNSLECYGGLNSEANNNYSQTDGPFSGSIGLRALSGTAVSYRNGVAKTTTSSYVTDAKPTAEEWVGGMNGIGTTYFNGTVGCWFRGMGLTNAEYITVAQATQKLCDTLAFANLLAGRGDSLVASGSGMTVTSGSTDATRWFQYSGVNLAVGGTNISQIQTALDLDLASTPNQRDWIGVYSAGRNDFRSNSDVPAMTAAILTLLNTPNGRGRYRYMEIPPQEMANNDEDTGTVFFIRRESLNNAVEAAIGQRFVRCVQALRASATLSNAADIASLDRGTTPSTLRGDTVHMNAAGWTVQRTMLWATLSTTLATPTDTPSSLIAPLAWITATTGTAATVGQVVNVCPGGWRGNPTFTYQWQRGGVDIGGATSASYTTVGGDSGTTLQCVVTATNAQGNASATSSTITVA